MSIKTGETRNTLTIIQQVYVPDELVARLEVEMGNAFENYHTVRSGLYINYGSLKDWFDQHDPEVDAEVVAFLKETIAELDRGLIKPDEVLFDEMPYEE